MEDWAAWPGGKGNRIICYFTYYSWMAWLGWVVKLVKKFHSSTSESHVGVAFGAV